MTNQSKQELDIYCTGCQKEVQARLTNGAEVYAHRQDLAALPFWICDTCKNFVGCHYKTDKPTTPLGVIATQEIKNARMKIHVIIDPLWTSGRISRRAVYKKLSDKLGYKYHTANIRSVEEARQVYTAAALLHNEMTPNLTAHPNENGEE